MRRLRNTFLLGTLVGLALAVVQSFKRSPQAAVAGSVQVKHLPNSITVDLTQVDETQPTTSRQAESSHPSNAYDETANTIKKWVDPVDEGCPDGFPVKAKLVSGIYHLEGGLSYERTKPDRCYPDVTAAEADGFRASRR